MLALISAFFSATASILEKKALFKEGAVGFSALFAVFNLFLAIPFFFFIDFSSLTTSGLAVLFFKSILGAIAFLCIMYGIKHLELSSALPLLVLTPGLVAIVAFITLCEALTGLQILGIVLLLIGTYVLQLQSRQGLFEPWLNFFKTKGYHYILVALILFTTTSVLDKAILKNFKVPVNAFMGFQHLFLAVIFLLIVLSLNKSTEFKHAFRRSWNLILMVSVVTIIYRYTQLSAVKVALLLLFYH